MKSTRMIELRTTMPGPGDEADHRSRREERVQQAVRGQDADQRKRNRRHDHQRRENDWNQPTTSP